MSVKIIEESWKVVQNSNYVTLKLIGRPRPEHADAFEAAVMKLATGETVLPIVVHCGELADINPRWVRVLVLLQKSLKTSGKDLRLILVAPAIDLFLKSLGVTHVLQVVPSLREAQVDLGLINARSFDVEFVNPFLAATLRVLKVQASIDAKPGKISLKADKSKLSGDVSGIIGLVSEGFSGSVVISFPMQTFLTLMSRMLGETYTEMNPELKDGAAELTNMVFGQAKIILNEKGYGLKTALPSVVTGQGHSFQSVARGTAVLIPFESDAGTFFVEICLSTEKQAMTAAA
jgi:chemotaxis protein CheX